MGALTGGGVKATPDDWLFVGTLLQTLEDFANPRHLRPCSPHPGC